MCKSNSTIMHLLYKSFEPFLRIAKNLKTGFSPILGNHNAPKDRASSVFFPNCSLPFCKQLVKFLGELLSYDLSDWQTHKHILFDTKK